MAAPEVGYCCLQGFSAYDEPARAHFGGPVPEVIGKSGQVGRCELDQGEVLAAGQQVPECRDELLVGQQEDGLSGQQGQPEAGDGGIEGERGVDGSAAAFAALIESASPGKIAGELGVADEHTLGGPGGSGGVKHVGGVVRREVDRRVMVRIEAGISEWRVQEWRVQHESRLGIGDHGLQACLWVGGIKGKIGGPCLERGQQGDQHVEGAGQGDADDGSGENSLPDQEMGQAVGAGVELRVAEGLPCKDGRGCAGIKRRHGFELSGCRNSNCIRPTHPTGRRQDPPLRNAQKTHIMNRNIRMRRNCFQQPDKTSCDVFRNLPIEQVRGVFQEAAEPCGLSLGVMTLLQTERQIEFRGFPLKRLRLCCKACQDQFCRRHILKQQHHLEKGLPGERTFRSRGLDDTFERDVLVAIGILIELTHALNQLAKCGIAR